MYPSVTTILKEVGLTADYSSVPPLYLARAAARGKGLHQALAWDAEGVLDTFSLHPDLLAPFAAYQKWAQDVGHVAEASELEIVHEGLGVVGHIDRLGSQGEYKTCLYDWKLSDKVDLLGATWQLGGGYATIWDHLHPERPVERCYVIQITKDGKVKPYDVTEQALKLDARGVFEAAVKVYHARMAR